MHHKSLKASVPKVYTLIELGQKASQKSDTHQVYTPQDEQAASHSFPSDRLLSAPAPTLNIRESF